MMMIKPRTMQNFYNPAANGEGEMRSLTKQTSPCKVNKLRPESQQNERGAEFVPRGEPMALMATANFAAIGPDAWRRFSQTNI